MVFSCIAGFSSIEIEAWDILSTFSKLVILILTEMHIDCNNIFICLNMFVIQVAIIYDLIWNTSVIFPKHAGKNETLNNTSKWEWENSVNLSRSVKSIHLTSISPAPEKNIQYFVTGDSLDGHANWRTEACHQIFLDSWLVLSLDMSQQCQL